MPLYAILNRFDNPFPIPVLLRPHIEVIKLFFLHPRSSVLGADYSCGRIARKEDCCRNT